MFVCGVMNKMSNDDGVKQLLAFFESMKQQANEDMMKSITYYMYRLRNVTDSDKQGIIGRIADEFDISQELATEQFNNMCKLTTAEALCKNPNIVVLESMWIDDLQNDINKFVHNKLRDLSNGEIDVLATKLICDQESAEVYCIENKQQTIEYLEQIRLNPTKCHDILFFEQEFDFYASLSDH